MKDEFSWLRDKNWPKVTEPKIIDHLKKENNFFEDTMKPYKELEQEIYNELKARIKEEDLSYPIKRDNYYYYTKLEKNKDYPIFLRKGKIEEVILDSNLLSLNKTSFSLGAVKVSNDHKKLLYSYDSDGSERYSIYVKDLETKLEYKDYIENTLGNIVWNRDSSGFFYVLVNEEWRSNKVFFHKLGTKQKDDILIYYEKDLSFHINIDQSASKEYLIIDISNGSYNEIKILSLVYEAESQTVIEREKKLLYSIDHINQEFYLSLNDLGENFRLVTLKEGQEFVLKNFIEIIPHHPDEYIVDFALYNKQLVIVKKILGLSNIFCLDINNYKILDKLKFSEEIFEAKVDYTTKEDDYLRISYSSLVTPRSVLEYEFTTRILHTRKTEEIPSGYNKNNYQSKRIWVKSQNEAMIPISLVYKKDIVKPAKLLLYAYGSYGYATPLHFRTNILSLLDRGFIYAIAHIRGGDELGFNWYKSAKFLTKKNTFNDFIACAEHLIAENYTSKDKLAIMGGSAGGMLMGVVLNERPDLFKSAVALVPFVDVLNTMLDETLPLTPPEFEEWGNPKNLEYYEYIKSYCPYSNVSNQHYPNILVTAGLTDPRVGYWEAAKWVAKLRKLKQDNNILLLKTDMNAGHKGQSGRFKGLEEIAMIYTFLITYT